MKLIQSRLLVVADDINRRERKEAAELRRGIERRFLIKDIRFKKNENVILGGAAVFVILSPSKYVRIDDTSDTIPDTHIVTGDDKN